MHAPQSQTQRQKSAEVESLWRFVRLDEFRYPSRPVTETVRRGISALLGTFRSRKDEPLLTERTEEALCALDVNLLATVAPGPDLAEPQSALSQAIDDAKSDLLAVAHTHHNYTDAILREWANASDALVLYPPKPGEILSGEWRPPRSGDNKTSDFIVVPQLEKFFLRHADGLDVLRRFLDYLAGQNRRTIIACDVSAWFYLRSAVQLDELTGTPIILDSFSSERLARWYLQLGAAGGGGCPAFLEEGSGQTVLSEADGDGSTGEDQKLKTSPFLDFAAWYSEGQPAVAWALWRNSLLGGGSGEDPAKVRIGAGETVWVKPWKDLPLPELPPSVGSDQVFLLALLLIHDGLVGKLAAELAGLSFAQTQGMLRSLQAASLIEELDGIWRISILAYPQVRRRVVGDQIVGEAFEVRG